MEVVATSPAVGAPGITETTTAGEAWGAPCWGRGRLVMACRAGPSVLSPHSRSQHGGYGDRSSGGSYRDDYDSYGKGGSRGTDPTTWLSPGRPQRQSVLWPGVGAPRRWAALGVDAVSQCLGAFTLSLLLVLSYTPRLRGAQDRPPPGHRSPSAHRCCPNPRLRAASARAFFFAESREFSEQLGSCGHLLVCLSFGFWVFALVFLLCCLLSLTGGSSPGGHWLALAVPPTAGRLPCGHGPGHGALVRRCLRLHEAH